MAVIPKLWRGENERFKERAGGDFLLITTYRFYPFLLNLVKLPEGK